MRTSDQVLHDALREAGFHTLAVRASCSEFNDYFGKHPLPQHALIAELEAIIAAAGPLADEQLTRDRARALIKRTKEGDFDGTKEEAEEWAATAEGQAARAELLGPNASRELLIAASEYQDAINFEAVGITPEQGRAGDEHGYVVGQDINATLARMAEPTGLDPRELNRYAEHVYTNIVKSMQESGEPPSVVIHGTLLANLLVGYHVRRMQEEARAPETRLRDAEALLDWLAHGVAPSDNVAASLLELGPQERADLARTYVRETAPAPGVSS